MANKATLKQNQLANRLTKAGNDLDGIMKDLQRDCKPYYKIVDLVRELDDISHEADKQTKDLARVNAARKKAATELRALQTEIKEGIAMAKEKMKNVV